MKLRHDWSERAVVLPTEWQWVASPVDGVSRVHLERDGDEVARATSIVKYGPGSRFPRHQHDYGEELLVLSGCLEDEYGRYEAGTYLRNPAGSAHAPYTETGCLLFVKLRYGPVSSRDRVVVQTRSANWHRGLVAGLSVMPLWAHRAESASLVRWEQGTRFLRHLHPGGEEILVLLGTFADDQGQYPSGTWLRNPPGSAHEPYSDTGCVILVKTGHLSASRQRESFEQAVEPIANSHLVDAEVAR